MQYFLKNDELLFLCILFGAGEILGIHNTLENASQSEIEKRWSEVSTELISKRYLYKNEREELQMDKAIAKMVSAIAFPDKAYVYTRKTANDAADTDYIFIKGQIAIQMKKEDSCIINIFQQRGELISFVHDYFAFDELAQDTEKYTLSITPQTLNDALEYTMKGDMQKGVECITVDDISTEAIAAMLSAFTEGKHTIGVRGFRNDEGGKTQTLINVSRSENEIWMTKLMSTDNYENVSIYKSNANEMIRELFAFSG